MVKEAFHAEIPQTPHPLLCQDSVLVGYDKVVEKPNKQFEMLNNYTF